MCTWLPEDKLLFTCDFFGSHLATSDVYADEATAYSGAKRYYAEIMMPFAAQVAKDVEKVAQFPIETICPSHGPLFGRPAFIMDLYREWAGGAPRNVVTLAYVSMHYTTRLMADHLTAALAQRGVAVERFELTGADIGDLASSLVDAATVLVGTPTVLTGPHPAAGYAALLMNTLKPKARQIGVFGSFGWAGKAPEKLAELLPNFKGELLAPVMVKGMPKAEGYAALDALAASIAERHQGLASR
jgi:flavorubredoxin